MPKKKLAQKHRPQLRIIGGQWRGRKLTIADIDGLRPTGDRIRETLFNWLQQNIHGAHCLDLFAGSGALGFEALSRGAEVVTLVEKQALAAAQLYKTCELLGIASPACNVIEKDALLWLTNTPPAKASIDILFLDPPFAAALWATTIEKIERAECLAEGALIYIETPKTHSLAVPSKWQLHREKFAGDIAYRLYRAT